MEDKSKVFREAFLEAEELVNEKHNLIIKAFKDMRYKCEIGYKDIGRCLDKEYKVFEQIGLTLISDKEYYIRTQNGEKHYYIMSPEFPVGLSLFGRKDIETTTLKGFMSKHGKLTASEIIDNRDLLDLNLVATNEACDRSENPELWEIILTLAKIT